MFYIILLTILLIIFLWFPGRLFTVLLLRSNDVIIGLVLFYVMIQIIVTIVCTYIIIKKINEGKDKDKDK